MEDWQSETRRNKFYILRLRFGKVKLLQIDNGSVLWWEFSTGVTQEPNILQFHGCNCANTIIDIPYLLFFQTSHEQFVFT